MLRRGDVFYRVQLHAMPTVHPRNLHRQRFNEHLRHLHGRNILQRRIQRMCIMSTRLLLHQHLSPNHLPRSVVVRGGLDGSDSVRHGNVLPQRLSQHDNVQSRLLLPEPANPDPVPGRHLLRPGRDRSETMPGGFVRTGVRTLGVLHLPRWLILHNRRYHPHGLRSRQHLSQRLCINHAMSSRLHVRQSQLRATV